MTADLESLRQRIISGCQRVMRLRIGVSAAERQMAAAQAQFWQHAADAELQRLHDLLPQNRAAGPEPGWVKVYGVEDGQRVLLYKFAADQWTAELEEEIRKEGIEGLEIVK